MVPDDFCYREIQNFKSLELTNQIPDRACDCHASCHGIADSQKSACLAFSYYGEKDRSNREIWTIILELRFQRRVLTSSSQAALTMKFPWTSAIIQRLAEGIYVKGMKNQPQQSLKVWLPLFWWEVSGLLQVQPYFTLYTHGMCGY